MIPQLKTLDSLLSESVSKMNQHGTVDIGYPNAFADKLVDDGYLVDTKEGVGDNKNYLVKLNGIIFSESGGYEQQYKDAKARRYQTNLSNAVIALGTGLAGLYALVQFGEWILSRSCHC